jgi:hypothetical protein
MTDAGCGTVDLNPPQHSIKQREKSGLGFYRPVAGRTVKVAAILGLDNPKAFGDALDLYNPRQLILGRKHSNAVLHATTAH